MLHRRKWSHLVTDIFAPILVGLLLPVLAMAGPPAWWIGRQVIEPDRPANDFAFVNQGQLKQTVKAAVEEMDAHLIGGAGPDLHALVATWSLPTLQTNDYAPVNVGQVKNLAAQIYRRLIEAGYTHAYPWENPVTPANDFAFANLGQVKGLFAFDLVEDLDGNGLPDWWERNYFGLTGLDPASDPAGTGMNLADKYQAGLNPTQASTAGDGIPDAWKVQYGIDPKGNTANDDPDHDGLTNAEEYERGTNPFLADTDFDGVDDAHDAVGYDPAFTHQWRPVPHFAVLKIDSGHYYTKVNDLGQMLADPGNENATIWKAGTESAVPFAYSLNNHGALCSVLPRNAFRQFPDGTSERLAHRHLPPPEPPGDGRAWELEDSWDQAQWIDDDQTVYGICKEVYRLPPLDPSNFCDGTLEKLVKGLTLWEEGKADAPAVTTKGELDDYDGVDEVIGKIQFGLRSFSDLFVLYEADLKTATEAKHNHATFRTGELILDTTTTLFINTPSGAFTPINYPIVDYCHPLYDASRQSLFTTASITESVWTLGADVVDRRTHPLTETGEQRGLNIRWANKIGLCAGDVDGEAALWAKPQDKPYERKPLQVQGSALKINNLGQAIIKGSVKNYWQNGKLYDLTKLASEFKTTESIEPLDISDKSGIILANIRERNANVDSAAFEFQVLLVPVEVKFAKPDSDTWEDLKESQVILFDDKTRVKIKIAMKFDSLSEVLAIPGFQKLKLKSNGTKPDGAELTLTAQNCTLITHDSECELQVALTRDHLQGLGVLPNAEEDGVKEIAWFDLVKDPTQSNLGDSQAFEAANSDVPEKDKRGRSYKEATIKANGDRPIHRTFVIAGGAQLITAEFGAASSEKRQLADQADVFYISGHGHYGNGKLEVGHYDEQGTFVVPPEQVPEADLVGPSDVKWTKEMKIVIVGGCSVFGIQTRKFRFPSMNHHDRNLYDNSYGNDDPSPGESWEKIPPKIKLGYCFTAPTDSQGSATIISNFQALVTAGKDPVEAWGAANNYDGSFGVNACAIDTRPTLHEYWYLHRVGLKSFEWARIVKAPNHAW